MENKKLRKIKKNLYTMWWRDIKWFREEKNNKIRKIKERKEIECYGEKKLCHHEEKKKKKEK